MPTHVSYQAKDVQFHDLYNILDVCLDAILSGELQQMRETMFRNTV